MKHQEVQIGRVYDCRAAVIPGIVKVLNEIPPDNRNQRGFFVQHVESGKTAVVVARHLHTPKS